MEKKHIGLILRELAKEKKISVIHISEKLGKTRQNVYQDFERDNFTNHTLEKYAEVFGVSLTELLSYNDTKKENDNTRDYNHDSQILEELKTIKEKMQEEINFLKSQIEKKDSLIEMLMGKPSVSRSRWVS